MMMGFYVIVQSQSDRNACTQREKRQTILKFPIDEASCWPMIFFCCCFHLTQEMNELTKFSCRYIIIDFTCSCCGITEFWIFIFTLLTVWHSIAHITVVDTRTIRTGELMVFTFLCFYAMSIKYDVKCEKKWTNEIENVIRTSIAT